MPRCLSQKVIEKEKRLQEALNELLKGQHPSVYATAEAHDINHVTLDCRLKGRKSIAEAHGGHQNLSIAEEKALSQWITHMTATGHLVQKAFIQEMAQQIQKSCHYDPKIPSPFYPAISDSWVQYFLHQHPHLATTISCTIEAAGLKETSKQAID